MTVDPPVPVNGIEPGLWLGPLEDSRHSHGLGQVVMGAGRE